MKPRILLAASVLLSVPLAAFGVSQSASAHSSTTTCTSITGGYGGHLVNGDHLNVTISIDGVERQVNAYVDRNIAGGYDSLGLRIKAWGGSPEITMPLSQAEIDSNMFTLDYRALLPAGTKTWTVTFVQADESESWPGLICGPTTTDTTTPATDTSTEGTETSTTTTTTPPASTSPAATETTPASPSATSPAMSSTPSSVTSTPTTQTPSQPLPSLVSSTQPSTARSTPVTSRPKPTPPTTGTNSGTSSSTKSAPTTSATTHPLRSTPESTGAPTPVTGTTAGPSTPSSLAYTGTSKFDAAIAPLALACLVLGCYLWLMGKRNRRR